MILKKVLEKVKTHLLFTYNSFFWKIVLFVRQRGHILYSWKGNRRQHNTAHVHIILDT